MIDLCAKFISRDPKMSINSKTPNIKKISRRIENFAFYYDGLMGDQVRMWTDMLDLSHLKMTELPAEIKRFKTLGSLNLSYNELDSLPDWIGSLKKLQYLDLRHCGLK